MTTITIKNNDNKGDLARMHQCIDDNIDNDDDDDKDDNDDNDEQW